MPATRHIDDCLWGRFEVDEKTGCWNWTGSKTKLGYGEIMRHRKKHTTHRLSWMETNGPIPEGMNVLHHCDNRLCGNPSHLYAGTMKDNMQDKRNRTGGPKLNWETADQVKAAPGTQSVIAAQFGISRSMVGLIKTGKRWAR